MELKLILTDGTEINLDAFGIPCHAVMTCATKEEMVETWAKLTEYNLRQVFVRDGEDVVYAFKDCSVNGE